MDVEEYALKIVQQDAKRDAKDLAVISVHICVAHLADLAVQNIALGIALKDVVADANETVRLHVNGFVQVVQIS